MVMKSSPKVRLSLGCGRERAFTCLAFVVMFEREAGRVVQLSFARPETEGM